MVPQKAISELRPEVHAVHRPVLFPDWNSRARGPLMEAHQPLKSMPYLHGAALQALSLAAAVKARRVHRLSLWLFRCTLSDHRCSLCVIMRGCKQCCKPATQVPWVADARRDHPSAECSTIGDKHCNSRCWNIRVRGVGGLTSLLGVDTPIPLSLKSSHGAIQDQRLVRPYEVSNAKPQLEIHLATSQPHVALGAFKLLHYPAEHSCEVTRSRWVLLQLFQKLHIDNQYRPHSEKP